MTDPRNPTSDDRYVAFDELADLVNTGQLSMLGAKALWYEVACRPPDQSTLFAINGYTVLPEAMVKI